MEQAQRAERVGLVDPQDGGAEALVDGDARFLILADGPVIAEFGHLGGVQQALPFGAQDELEGVLGVGRSDLVTQVLEKRGHQLVQIGLERGVSHLVSRFARSAKPGIRGQKSVGVAIVGRW